MMKLMLVMATAIAIASSYRRLVVAGGNSRRPYRLRPNLAKHSRNTERARRIELEKKQQRMYRLGLRASAHWSEKMVMRLQSVSWIRSIPDKRIIPDQILSTAR